jgi:hypothetical protein
MTSASGDIKQRRNQAEARRIAKEHYPYPGCCLYRQTVGVELAHLDHRAENNDADNLAWLCRHHHRMFDVGLFSLKALKSQRDHWQTAKGEQTYVYMRDAGLKAAKTREPKGIGSKMALKAWDTRRKWGKKRVAISSSVSGDSTNSMSAPASA